MPSMDVLLRATAQKVPLRFVIVDATRAANEIGARHEASGWTLEILGESVVSSLLLASGLKFPGTLSLRYEFNGEISFVQSDATPAGLVRASIPASEVSGAGSFEPIAIPSRLVVRKFDEKVRVLQNSITETPSRYLGPNLSYYLLQSEQTRSAVGLCARACRKEPGRLEFAAGFLVEAFPGLKDDDLDAMESLVLGLPPLDSFFDGDSYRPQALLEQLSGSFGFEVLKEVMPRHYCPCSQVRTLQSLKAFTEADLRSMIVEGADLEVVCEFCRTRYEIPIEDVQAELDSRKDPEQN